MHLKLLPWVLDSRLLHCVLADLSLLLWCRQPTKEMIVWPGSLHRHYNNLIPKAIMVFQNIIHVCPVILSKMTIFLNDWSCINWFMYMPTFPSHSHKIFVDLLRTTKLGVDLEVEYVTLRTRWPVTDIQEYSESLLSSCFIGHCFWHSSNSIHLNHSAFSSFLYYFYVYCLKLFAFL